MRVLLFVLGLVLAFPAFAEDIPFRYPVREGFILTIDDASSRAVPRSDPLAQAALDGLAAVLESDRFRIPVAYGRTLAWNVGTAPADGTTREDMLTLFETSRAQDVARAQPENVLFLRLSKGQGRLVLRVDWVDAIRGEILGRYASQPVDNLEAMGAFMGELGDALLNALGPAPPRGYGDVPPAWLIQPIAYRIDFRDIPEDIRKEVLDAMIVEFPYYIDSSILRDTPERLTVSYQTRVPSWMLAEHMADVFGELDYRVGITPRNTGLRIEPAQ